MDGFSPWLVSCGLLCVWPLLLFGVGVLIGSRRLRSPVVIRNPLRRGDEDVIGYGKGG
jgi:hypothetical protein